VNGEDVTTGPVYVSASMSPLPSSDRILRSATGEEDRQNILDGKNSNVINKDELGRSVDISSEKERSNNLLGGEVIYSQNSTVKNVNSSSEERSKAIKTPELNCTGESPRPRQGTVWCKPFELLRKEVVEEKEVEVIAEIPVGNTGPSTSKESKSTPRESESFVEKCLSLKKTIEKGLGNKGDQSDNVGNQSNLKVVGGKRNTKEGGCQNNDQKQLALQTRLAYPCPTCRNCRMVSLSSWKSHMMRIHNISDAEFSGELVEWNPVKTVKPVKPVMTVRKVKTVKKYKASPSLVIDPFNFWPPRDRLLNYPPGIPGYSPDHNYARKRSYNITWVRPGFDPKRNRGNQMW